VKKPEEGDSSKTTVVAKKPGSGEASDAEPKSPKSDATILGGNFKSDVIFNRAGVNFINILRARFSYEHHVSAAFYSYMYVEKRRSYKKFVRIMLKKLTTGLTLFHQHFTISFLHKFHMNSFLYLHFGCGICW